MLVASKCDIPQESRQVNPHFLDQVRRNLASVAIAEVSFKSPQSIKLCLLNMINRVITSPRGKSIPAIYVFTAFLFLSLHRLLESVREVLCC